MKNLVLSMLVLVLFGCSAHAVTNFTGTWGASLWDAETQDALKITGVTYLANGEVAVSGETGNLRGVIYELTYDAASITSITNTGFDAVTTPDDLAYNGSFGGGDQYYLGRYTGGRGRIEQWNTATGWGTEVANFASYVLGLDTTGTVGNLAMGFSKTAKLYDTATAALTAVTASGTSYFHGATSLGDLNQDGFEDFLFSSGPGPIGTEASFASNLWYMESNGLGGFAIDFLDLTSTVTTFSGVENLGDIDNDGYLELMLTRFSRTDSHYSWIDIVETDMPSVVPEPATIAMLGFGCIGLLRKKK